MYLLSSEMKFLLSVSFFSAGEIMIFVCIEGAVRPLKQNIVFGVGCQTNSLLPNVFGKHRSVEFLKYVFIVVDVMTLFNPV